MSGSHATSGDLRRSPATACNLRRPHAIFCDLPRPHAISRDFQEEVAELALHEWVREMADELKRRSPVIEELCNRGMLHLEGVCFEASSSRLLRV